VKEEIKMVEDMPDDLVHEIFLQRFWDGHPLGRPILGTPESIDRLTPEVLSGYFRGAYTADRLIVAVAGNLEHERVRELVERSFGSLQGGTVPAGDEPPSGAHVVLVRDKALEQCHICLGVEAYPQDHDDRYVALVLNTLLGGSMSSRLFQNVREKRGLAYSVGSGISAFRDAGLLTIYAGCANERVGEVVEVIVEELRRLVTSTIDDIELQRAKDNVKGGFLLGLESTWQRAAYLARQEIYFGRIVTIDETIAGIDAVTTDAARRVARELFTAGPLSLAVLGAVDGWTIACEQLQVRA
jgi:predicted Zn-dependent peptidase